MGQSHDDIKGFPAGVRHNLGNDLRRLQEGKRSLDSGPMPGIGPGVFEIRDEDIGTWYRVIYLKETNGTIYVLHCFTKKSNQTPGRDLNTAYLRLVEAKKEIAEEERDAKRETRHNG